MNFAIVCCISAIIIWVLAKIVEVKAPLVYKYIFTSKKNKELEEKQFNDYFISEYNKLKRIKASDLLSQIEAKDLLESKLNDQSLSLKKYAHSKRSKSRIRK